MTEGAWPERVQQKLSEVANHVGYMLRAISAGEFGPNTPHGDALCSSRDALAALHAAEHWCEHAQPSCEHVWHSAGEGYFQIFEWCSRCGVLTCNGDMAFAGCDDAVWL